MRQLFNPTIEIVAFHLCGWCMLGVFLLPAFTHHEYECQDLCHRGSHILSSCMVHAGCVFVAGIQPLLT